jgi:hypothetical protein
LPAGIDIEAGTVQMLPGTGRVLRWEHDPNAGLLCGRVTIGRFNSPRPPRFHRYLLRLNWDLRFVAIGMHGEQVALQAALPADDQRWLTLASDALAGVVRMLESQWAWWRQPSELLDEVLSQAGL